MVVQLETVLLESSGKLVLSQILALLWIEYYDAILTWDSLVFGHRVCQSVVQVNI